MITPPPLHVRALLVDGLRTRLIEGGASGRPNEAVVFVHGNPGSAEDWIDLMQAVAPYARVLALDMPGFGRADKPPDFPYAVESGARFLAHALEQLGVDRAHLVLHDFGGPWGLAWAAVHPDRFASVVLINTGVLKGYRWHYMARLWRTPILGELAQWLTNRAVFRLALRHGCPSGLPEPFVERMYDDLDWGTRRAILKLYRATGDLGGLAEGLSTRLTPLRRPALVLWGQADPYLPVRFARQQAETFPDAQVVVLPRSGHFPFADQPQAVIEHLLPFMRRQLEPASHAPLARAG